MDLANVIPIDAQAARLLERRQIRFRWFVAAVTSLWVAALVRTILFTPLPPLGTFAILAVLVVLAEHHFVVFGDETSMSASIIVIVGSIFVFADTSPLAGPMLIASLGALYFPLLRARAFAKAAFNGAAFGLAAVTAAGVSVGTSSRPLDTVLYAAVVTSAASAVYWCINSVLTGSASAICLDSNLPRSIRTQATSEWQALLLTMAAGLVGSALKNGVFHFAVAAAVLLILFETFTQRSFGHRTIALNRQLHASALLLGLSAVVFFTSVLGAAVAVTGTYLFAATQRRLEIQSSRTLGVATCVAVAAVILRMTAVNIGLQFTLCTIVAIAMLSTLMISPGLQRSNSARGLIILSVAFPSISEIVFAIGFAAALTASHALANENYFVLTGLAGVLALGGLLQRRALKRRFRESHDASGRRSSVGASR